MIHSKNIKNHTHTRSVPLMCEWEIWYLNKVCIAYRMTLLQHIVKHNIIESYFMCPNIYIPTRCFLSLSLINFYGYLWCFVYLHHFYDSHRNINPGLLTSQLERFQNSTVKVGQTKMKCLVNVRDIKYDHQQATAGCARALIKIIPRYIERARELAENEKIAKKVCASGRNYH